MDKQEKEFNDKVDYELNRLISRYKSRIKTDQSITALQSNLELLHKSISEISKIVTDAAEKIYESSNKSDEVVSEIALKKVEEYISKIQQSMFG